MAVTVLCFHPDRSAADLLCGGLVRAGFEVHWVRGVAEAVPWIAPERADVMLIYAPDRPGRRTELLRAVGELRAPVPVVLVARWLTADLLDFAERLERVELLLGEPGAGELAEAVRGAVTRYRATARGPEGQMGRGKGHLQRLRSG